MRANHPPTEQDVRDALILLDDWLTLRSIKLEGIAIMLAMTLIERALLPGAQHFRDRGSAAAKNAGHHDHAGGARSSGCRCMV
jgi:hypothetical protein